VHPAVASASIAYDYPYWKYPSPLAAPLYPLSLIFRISACTLFLLIPLFISRLDQKGARCLAPFFISLIGLLLAVFRDADLDLLRLRLFSLGHSHVQHAIAVLRVNPFRLHCVGQREAGREG